MFTNIIHSLFARGLVSIINFFILIISSRYLGVNSRGEISLLLLNLMLIQLINEIFTGYSLVHFIPRSNLKKILLWGLIYSIACCTILNVLLMVAGRQVGEQPWLIFLLSFFVVLNTFFCILLLGKEKVRTYNQLSLLQPLLLLGGLLLWIFLLRKYTLESYLFPLLLSFVVALFFLRAIGAARNDKAGFTA